MKAKQRSKIIAAYVGIEAKLERFYAMQECLRDTVAATCPLHKQDIVQIDRPGMARVWGVVREIGGTVNSLNCHWVTSLSRCRRNGNITGGYLRLRETDTFPWKVIA